MAVLEASQERRRFERLSSVREIVFGIQDGVLTTAGVLCGLSGAVSNRGQVILAALASTAAGALSMGAGAYLGTKSETEVLRAELERARQKTAGEPYIVQESLLQQLANEGLSREASYRVVKLLSSAPQALIATAEEKIYGLGSAMLANPVIDGVTMGIAFLLGALVPLMPYVMIGQAHAGLLCAIATTATALFAVGYFEGWLADRRRRWVAGLHFLAVAVGAAIVGYLIGLAIAPLGGPGQPPPVP
ncbi:MAG: VIT1/CCC1 transporter family protein [Candidatus Binataceae bacterium]